MINVAKAPDALAAYATDKGYFDALFEASGAEVALRNGIEVVRPRGVIVQLGLGGDMTIPINLITAKELELRGTFRFHEEFALALEFMGKGLIDVKPLITATAPLEKARDAFELGRRPVAVDEGPDRLLKPAQAVSRATTRNSIRVVSGLRNALRLRASSAPSAASAALRPRSAQSTAIVVSRG